MDLRSRLILSRLRGDAGSVTAEAAIGLAALVGVAGLMLKALGVLLVFLQLQATATHASQIASASGDPALRMAQAEAFIGRQAPRADGRVTGGGFGVLVELRQSEGLEILTWQPEIVVSSSAMFLDSAEW